MPPIKMRVSERSRVDLGGRLAPGLESVAVWDGTQEMYAFTLAVYNAGIKHVDLHTKMMGQPPWDTCGSPSPLQAARPPSPPLPPRLHPVAMVPTAGGGRVLHVAPGSSIL